MCGQRWGKGLSIWIMCLTRYIIETWGSLKKHTHKIGVAITDAPPCSQLEVVLNDVRIYMQGLHAFGNARRLFRVCKAKQWCLALLYFSSGAS